MSSKPIGRGTRNITINVPLSLYMELSRLASVSGCKMGMYARTILLDAVKRGILVRENKEDRAAWETALVREETPPRIEWEIATPMGKTQMRHTA